MTEVRPESLTVRLNTTPSADWDTFVKSQPAAPVYLASRWVLLPCEVFGHRAFFIEARQPTGEIIGVLPIVQQRSLLGNFATSLPFFNYGGALAVDDTVALAMMRCARDFAAKNGCSYLECRDVHRQAPGWQVRTDKVTMVLQLPETIEALAKQLGSKLRAQIKRAEKEVVQTRVGGRELVDDFYDVFARNMRDLGTPVYPRRFFSEICARFPEQTALVVVSSGGVPTAAAFLVINDARAEIPWAACRSEAKASGMNMKLYWESLVEVMRRGCRSFDFGRSTVDSGTYRFKQQWGAVPVPLHWHRWERGSSSTGKTGAPTRGRTLNWLTHAWQRLPLPVANALGPMISPGLPW